MLRLISLSAHQIGDSFAYSRNQGEGSLRPKMNWHKFFMKPEIKLFKDAEDSDPITQKYKRSHSSNIQARLQGREVWEPDIDLKNYRCAALVDWLELEVETVVSTNFMTIQALIKERIARVLNSP